MCKIRVKLVDDNNLFIDDHMYACDHQYFRCTLSYYTVHI